MAFDIAIDFGENTVTVAARGWKDSVSSPSAVARMGDRKLAMGEEAHNLLGRAPKGLKIEYPLHNGRLMHEKWIREWVRYLINQCAPNARVKKASLLFTLPPTENESMARVLKEAAMACDMQDVWVVDRTLAACAGMNMDMNSTDTVLYAGLEEGYVDAALICMGRVQRRACVCGGLQEVDSAIIALVRRQYGLSIGPVTAAELRNQLGAARAIDGVKANALGLDMQSGFPAMKEIESALGEEAARPVCDTLCECVQRIAGQASEEEAAELKKNPVWLCGPGAAFVGLESRITEKTGLACRISQDHVGKGLKRFLGEDDLKKICRKL